MSPKKQRAAPWNIEFFKRHLSDDPDESVPAQDFLDETPPKVAAKIAAVAKAVADAPPPSFSGGGLWEAMHGNMGGYYEIRVDGPKRHHYRVFCLLERNGNDVGLDGPSIILLCGKEKRFMAVLSDADYAEVRGLGAEYRKRNPRSVSK